MNAKSMIKRFDIYWVNLDPTVGKEIKKTRPCVVVSPDFMNNALGTVTVVPLTSTIIDWPFRMKLRIKGKVSSAACDQLRTVTKERLKTQAGRLTALESSKLASIIQEIFAD